MGSRKEFSTTFHKIVINGALWIYAAALVFIGIRNLDYCWQDHVPNFALIVIGQCILFASAILLIKARFDLARMRKIGAKEVLIAGIATTAVFLYDLLAVWPDYGSVVEKSAIFPLLSFCWSFSIYRYYMSYPEMLND